MPLRSPDSATAKEPQKASESTVGTSSLKENDEVSTGVVVLGAAAVGATLLGAAAFVVGKHDDDSEDELSRFRRGGREGGESCYRHWQSALDSTEPSNEALELSARQENNEISTDAAVLGAFTGGTAILGSYRCSWCTKR